VRGRHTGRAADLREAAAFLCGTGLPRATDHRELPVFGRLVGRSGDVLRTASGGTVTPAEAVALARPGTGSVVDLQVRQEADLSLTILLVQVDTPEAEVDRGRIAAVVEPPRRRW
jgi:hypothetical protein